MKLTPFSKLIIALIILGGLGYVVYRRYGNEIRAYAQQGTGKVEEVSKDDLSQIGKKYKREELLESLVEPSKKIDPQFAAYLLITKAGKVYTGIITERTKQQVVLNVLKDGKAEQVRIPASEVEELVLQKKSLMPDQLLRDLTAQQAADLLEFLASLK